MGQELVTDDRQLSLFDALNRVPTETTDLVRTVIKRAQRQSYERSGSTESFDVWIAERV